MGRKLVKEDIPFPPVPREGEDNVICGRNNQLIIFKRDRPADFDSGYGDEEGTGTVHIVVGRQDQDTDFEVDSSFIYMTMKTDVDANLKLDEMTDGMGESIEAKTGPAVITKSDNVRIVHRASGDVRITSEDGSNFINLTPDRCEIKLGASWLRIEDGTITVEAGTIKLGKDANAEHVMLGDMFLKDFLNHTHQSPSGPTSKPIEAIITNSTSKRVLSEKSWVE